LAISGAWARYDGDHSQKLALDLSRRFLRNKTQLCCSGTLAVELALRGCRIGVGDEVILAAYDFPGNFRAIEATGASIVLVDIGARSWTIDNVENLERATGDTTKAILVSHLHGTLAPMRAICDWAASRGIAVIEDACQMPGAIVDGEPVGSWGDCSVLSFGGSKLLSAGRGGAVMTNDSRIDQRMRIFRERGNDAFAMSELQAAVLEPQLRQLDSKRKRHSEAVRNIESQVSSQQIEFAVRQQPIEDLSFYKWAFRTLGDTPEVVDERNAIRERLLKNGLAVGSGFRGFLTRGTSRCRRSGELTNAANASRSTIVVHHTALNPVDAPSLVARLNEL
jgi:perosamine synthetase